MKNPDTLPSCADYSVLLNKAHLKLKISIDDARNKYGLYTYTQWNELLNMESGE